MSANATRPRRDLPPVLRVSQERIDHMTDDEKWAWLSQACDAEAALAGQGVL